jgi:hypothetical protein
MKNWTPSNNEFARKIMISKMLVFLVVFPIAFAAIAQEPRNPTDNKIIGVCGHYKDTLSYDDLKCGEITVDHSDKITVTSFTLSYYDLDRKNLVVCKVFESRLKQTDLDAIVAAKPKKIFVEEVIGEGTGGIVNEGHKNIYLK